MPTPNRPRLRPSLRPLTLCSALLCLPAPWAQAAENPASQQADSQRQAYDIGPGPLVSVLNRFAEQSAVFVAGHNDLALLGKTHVGRDINRHHYTRDEIDALWPEQEQRERALRGLLADGLATGTDAAGSSLPD